MLFVSTGKDPGFTHLSSLLTWVSAGCLGIQPPAAGRVWHQMRWSGEKQQSTLTGGTIRAIVILLLWQAAVALFCECSHWQPHVSSLSRFRLWISIFIRLFQWQEAPSHIMQNPLAYACEKKKKKASCNFVFFTCPCKENEIIISSEIDSSLKKLLTSRKRITSHNRGPQIIVILLKHIFQCKYRWESKLGLHKSFWYCKEFDALIFYFFMNTFLLPFKF